MAKNKILWEPLPGSQSAAIACPCDEILFHGTRGPGKTACQLAYFLGRVGIGYGRFWRGVIFDRAYKNLDDIIEKSRAMIPDIFPEARFLASKSDLGWRFPDGETLLFRHMAKPSQYRQYHGHEYPFIGWNELTSFPTSEMYDLMKSCNRSSFVPAIHSPELRDADFKTIETCEFLGEDLPAHIQGRMLPNIPLVTFSTTNPFGPGHSWVQKKFIIPAPPGQPIKNRRKVYNPRTKQEEVVESTQVALFGSYKENKFLDAKYIAQLDAIKDVNKRRAWLGGDWSITSGGAFDDLWQAGKHIVPRFIVPKEWKVKRSFDWGSSHPFSVGFWAIANGEEVKLFNGRTFCPPKGSVVRIGEIYGAETSTNDLGQEVPNYGSNKGLKLSARAVARLIVAFEKELLEEGWIQNPVEPGPADGQIFNVNEAESGSIAQLMAAEGVNWYAADKSAGTRKNGLELMRVALENAANGEGPGLFVSNNCEAFLETVPTLPRDENNPDDVDTTAEDHVYDEVRYMVLDDKPTFATGEMKAFKLLI